MMNYQQSLQYLNSFLNLEKIEWSKSNRHWNLDRMNWLLKKFNHPEKSFTPVIIAGTKGKGSTGFFLESILESSKVKTGFYSSPHLVDPRERIRICGKMVSKKIWAENLAKIKRKLYSKSTAQLKGELTYFEISTLLAALVFKQMKVRIGLFEVGMGGRLDATNALGAKFALMTPIHLDHESVLGNTISKIAAEKAAVIRSRAEVISAPQSRDAMHVIKRQAQIQKASLWSPAKLKMKTLGLSGDYQSQNAAVALKAAHRLEDRLGLSISEAATQRGLKNQNWPARFEVTGKNPQVILDGAHNPASIKALVASLKKKYSKTKGVVLFSAQKDKKTDEMLKHLSGFFKTIVLVQTPGSRTQSAEFLCDQARSYFGCVIPVGTAINRGLEIAKEQAGKKGFVLVTGSFYLVGQVRGYQHG